MIFVDTNVIMYAVGREHPLRKPAQKFFENAVEHADVALARALVESHASLGARDLLHLACCKRREVSRIKTYDRALAAAMPGG